MPPKRKRDDSAAVAKAATMNKEITIIQRFFGVTWILEAVARTDVHHSSLMRGKSFPSQRLLVFDAPSPESLGHYIVETYSKTGYSTVNKEEAYRLGFQKKGSQGLCMLFASMIFNRETSTLIPGDLVHNAREALLWAATRLSATKEPRKLPLGEIAIFDIDEDEPVEVNMQQGIALARKLAKSDIAMRALATESYVEPTDFE
jgi:hypothetical protein